MIAISNRLKAKYILFNLVWMLGVIPTSAHAYNENMLLLTYLYNFGKLTKWSETAVQNDQSFNLCLYGDTSDIYQFSDKLKAKKIHQLTINVKMLKRGESALDCHVLYIAQSENRYFLKLLERLKGKKILTISMIEGTQEVSPMVHLFYQNKKLRFNVSLIETKKADLSVSSQLLELAYEVKK